MEVEDQYFTEFLSPIGVISAQAPPMKSFLFLLLTLVVLLVVVGGGGALVYLAKTSEITRSGVTPPVN
jgi:hypothetical protein